MKRYRTIPVNRLQIGDHVIGIDKSWLETPFLSHRFRIRSKEDIERLRASGVSMVTIEADSPEQDNPALPPPPDSGETLPLREVSLPSYKVAEMLTSLHKYLVYKYKTLFEELRQMPESGKVDTTPFVNALEEVEKLGRQYPDAYLFLAHLQSTDDETFIHSVNTMFLSLYLAHYQESTREDAILWGLSGLFHDLGKVHIPLEILHKTSPLTPEEWTVIQDHPVMGQKLLSGRSNLPSMVARVAGEHHVRRNGKSYPDNVLYAATDSVTRAIMILDTFDAMTSDRSYRRGVSPSKSSPEDPGSFPRVAGSRMEYEIFSQHGHLSRRDGGRTLGWRSRGRHQVSLPRPHPRNQSQNKPVLFRSDSEKPTGSFCHQTLYPAYRVGPEQPAPCPENMEPLGFQYRLGLCPFACQHLDVGEDHLPAPSPGCYPDFIL